MMNDIFTTLTPNSDGMIYLLFLISWLALMGAMSFAHRGDKQEAFKNGVKHGREDERRRAQYQANIDARWNR